MKLTHADHIWIERHKNGEPVPVDILARLIEKGVILD